MKAISKGTKIVGVSHKLVNYFDMEDVRAMCIKYDFYTCGDCEAYDHMLSDLCRGDMTSDRIIEIAEDIVEHSDPENKYLKSYEPVDVVVGFLLEIIQTEIVTGKCR